MKSKVELNHEGVNYLKKNEEPLVLNRSARKTRFQVERGEKLLEFEVSNDLVKQWFR